VTTVQKLQKKVNIQKYQNKSICYSVAYILGRDSECPDPALSDFARLKFSTKISTGFVEIFDMSIGKMVNVVRKA
jgi:hypothetical protein